ncbi:MAG: DUF6537 domain-containing protein, partial [Pseudomonadota bacterium]
PTSPREHIRARAERLRDYQNQALADRFRTLVDRIEDEDLRQALAEGYYKLLAYKDEYEVARLHAQNIERMVAETFDTPGKIEFHLAPPMLPGKDAQRRPKKRRFGPWVLPLFKLMARGKFLRGTWADPFGRTAERRMERALIAQYEADMEEVLAGLTSARREIAIMLARLPLDIRGFGPVKHKYALAAAKRREELLAAFRAGGTAKAAAD